MRAPLALLLAGLVLTGCSSSDEPEEADEPSASAPATEEATDTATPLKGGPVGVADVGGEPWFVLVAAGTVVNADGLEVPAGGTSVTRVADGSAETVPILGCIGAQGVAEADCKVFVSCTMAHRVVVLDAASLEVVGEIPDVTDADAVVTDGSTVYVGGQSGPTVWQIDAASAEVIAVTRLGDTAATPENVGAAIVGTDLVVTHPDTGFYTLPLT